MEKKVLLKIQNENLLPKGGSSDQPSLEHKIFLHFFIIKEKANVPKYIFKHMIKELREKPGEQKVMGSLWEALLRDSSSRRDPESSQQCQLLH